MNLKLSGLILFVGVLLGGGLVIKFKPDPKPVAPVAIPESQELEKLKKQLAEFSSQKKSSVKEYNCANGALSKETNIDEVTAAKIAKESEEKVKKVSELVVLPQVIKPRDTFKLNLNSKLQPGFEISPVDHYWLGYKKDFRAKEDIYEVGYSNSISNLLKGNL